MKFSFALVALCFGLCLACCGCGSGVTVMAMVSPTISGISPQVVTAGSASAKITVKGANFDSKSSVVFNGAAVPTSVVDSQTLSAQIAASSIASPAVAPVTVRNSAGVSSNSVDLTVASAQVKSSNPAMTVSTTSLAAAGVGSLYTVNLMATGGSGTYTWSLSSGSLPSGLALSSSGVISGTPTATGTSAFTVQVKDSSAPPQTQSASYTLVVAPPSTAASPLAMGNVVFAPGQVGSAYSTTLTASGGTPGYTWLITAGSLPAGLSLSSTGVISGTPMSSGSSSFTITVSDSSSPALTRSANGTISVSPGALAISTTTLPTGRAGASYGATLSATGGIPGYTWSITSGSLPAGLTLSSSGTISGIPASSGTQKFTATVKDSSSPSQSQSASYSIHINASSLSISSGSLASAQVGSSYAATLAASGGTAAYTWSIASGNLPAGLSLTSGGVISGTPTTSGRSAFTLMVTDSSSPSQTATASESISVSASGLSISSAGLTAGKTGVVYSAALTASGGTPSYLWSVASGSLPTGLTMSSAGVVSGTPTSSGTFIFTASVQDSGSPAQSVTSTESITIAASNAPLAITSSTLGSGQVGVAYSGSMSASGGTAAYTWSISSGSLPAGLTLSPASGVISGTPTASGTASFTVQVTDSSSPAQTQAVSVSLPVAAAAASNGSGTTWYVRADGGTRYSNAVPTGQCDGKSDLPYSGDGGVNEHCAFNDVRFFWTDGSYCVDSSAGSTCWTWIGSGGDTYIIRGGPWRIGQSGPNSNDYFGLAGNPYGAGVPAPHSGTSSAHTRILGENYLSCSAQSARTQLHGGYGVWSVLNMAGASYVDVACLDITDWSACGRSGQATTCNTNYPLSDYATNGVAWNNTSTNDTLTDVRIHGLSATGMIGATGDGVVMKDVQIIGNAGAGWNADDGSGTTGVGNLLVENYEISWNGCSEEYPIVDPLPYQECRDDNSGGYGDGFGTATVPSLAPGWHVHFDQGIVSYNTQDGLDALHLIGNGSSMTITRTLAYGNMGQQIKVGGAAGAAINNVIFTNCNALRGAIPGTPAGYNSKLSDFCRAADSGVVVTVGKGSLTTFQFNTIYSASATGIEVDCDTTEGPCDSSSQIDFRNNIFLGFMNNVADGYPGGGTGNYSNPIYVGVLDQGYPDPFLNSGSLNSNNLTFHGKSGWTCPATWLNERSAICSDPDLTDESWHLYGYGNVTPLSSTSVVQGAGAAIPSVTTDYTGALRGTPPSIGAYE